MTNAAVTTAIALDGPEAGYGPQIIATYDPEDRWNGFIAAPRVDRENAEKIAAWLMSTESDQLITFDDDVLVLTSQDDEPYVERVEPDAEGLYNVGFGWVWCE